MKSSRAWFKYAICFIKNHESQLRKDSLAKKLSQSKPEDSWKEIQQINHCNIPLPNSVEGISEKEEITELWRSHFKQLFNCISDIDLQQMKYDDSYTNDIVVEVSEVKITIKHLDINKTCGMDGIYAEHLKHCDKRIVPLLAMCITGFIVHGFLPNSLLSVVLVPIIKDKCGKTKNKENYRPIALASIMSKIFKNILLDRMLVILSTMSNQFGLKKHGTDVYLCLKGSY